MIDWLVYTHYIQKCVSKQQEYVLKIYALYIDYIGLAQ